MISSSRLQSVAEIVMVLGIIALCQTWNLFLHRYAVTIILIGLVTFLLTNGFGTKIVTEDDDAPQEKGH